MLLQPVGQKRHTNVATVSYRKKDEKSGDTVTFEIACYKNKVADYLAGAEDKLEDVLQSDKVYTSVSKGELATAKSLKKSFGTSDTVAVCREILRHGVTRATEKEREHELEYLQNEVLNAVTSMVMERLTGLPIPPSRVQAVLFEELKFRIKPCPAKKRPEEHSKVLAKDAVKMIETDSRFNRKIARVPAKLKLSVALPAAGAAAAASEAAVVGVSGKEEIMNKIKEKLDQTEVYNVEEEQGCLTVICHPRLFKEFKDMEGVAVDLLDSKVFMPLPAVAGEAAAPVVVEAAVAAVATGGGLTCRTCKEAQFGNMADLREHYKSSWHEHNKKRQVKGLAALDHLEYELLPESVKKNFLAVDA